MFAVGAIMHKISERITEKNFSGGFLTCSQLSTQAPNINFCKDKNNLLSNRKILFDLANEHYHRYCKPLINFCNRISTTLFYFIYLLYIPFL